MLSHDPIRLLHARANPRVDAQNAQRYHDLVWCLTTCPNGSYRDGDRAIQLAEKACQLTDYADARSLDSLAAAHAEKENFADAVTWQIRALELAAPDEESGMRWRLELYEAGKPCHQTPCPE